jgi:hypothetical protein
MAYCVVATDLKPYLGIAAATVTDDTLLAQLVTRAQAMIDTYCGRVFEASADSTKYLDAIENVDKTTLYLSNVGDLCAITTITNGDDVEVESDEYVTQPRNTTPYYAIKLLASANKAWTYDDDPENAISIEGRWAYSTTAPADITHACTRLAAWLYAQKDTAGEMDRAIVAGNATILPARLPSDVIEILKPYRRLV